MKSRLHIVLSFVLLAGCARFQSRPIVPPDTAAAWDARSLDNPALQTFLAKNLTHPPAQWPLKSWDFETLTLAAFYYHPSLEVARAQWQVALGSDKTAAQRPNPTITAAPGYDFSAMPPANPWIPILSFDWPLETMGKRGYRMAEAQHLSESARWNIATTAWAVRANLRTSLIDYASSKQRITLLEKQNAAQTRAVQSMVEQANAGAIASSELTLVRVAQAQIQLALSDARSQNADARVRVADAIGISVKALDGIELNYPLDAAPSASAVLSASARGEALRSRADILGALAEYAASQSALQLEIAKQYPDIHLGPSYQFDQGDHKFNLGATMELPVLNQNQGPIAQAEARRVEAAARFNALQAKVILEIDRATAAYQTAQENLMILQNLASIQQKQNESVTAQAQAGAADQLALENSEIEVDASALAQLDGRVKAQQAFGALEDALQRPIDSLKQAIIETQPLSAMKETKP